MKKFAIVIAIMMVMAMGPQKAFAQHVYGARDEDREAIVDIMGKYEYAACYNKDAFDGNYTLITQHMTHYASVGAYVWVVKVYDHETNSVLEGEAFIPYDDIGKVLTAATELMLM